MSTRGRTASPHPLNDEDVDMDNDIREEKALAKVVIVTNLTRNVVEAHLRTVFGFYGDITKIDLPLFGKSGQNRGKAALEYSSTSAAHKAASHMDGGQLDGAILKVELSDLPVRSRSLSRSRPARNGARDAPRSISRSRSRSRGVPGRKRQAYDREPRFGDSYRGRGFGRRGPPGRDSYRPHSRSRTRSRSPIRRPIGIGRIGARRRSPSYERGGTGYRGRSRSRSHSAYSSRSRSRSYTPSRSRSRTRSRSYSSYSRYSRSKSKSRSRSISHSRGRRSHSRDDIRDSRSRSPE